MSKQTVSIAPTAETAVALYERHALARDYTYFIAKLATENGHGDVTLDRLSVRLFIDGNVVGLGESAEVSE